MKNQKGFITLDFLFAFVLVFGMTMLLLRVSLTLTVVEITQYITFSAARNVYPAHINVDTQYNRGLLKYQELRTNPVFAPLYQNGWFSIDNEPSVGDIGSVRPELVVSENVFLGIGTNFIARILDFRIPFYGATTEEGDGSGDGFATFVGSYLGREPTIAECLNFSNNRWELLRRLNRRYDSGVYPPGQIYVAMMDNGC